MCIRDRACSAPDIALANPEGHWYVKCVRLASGSSQGKFNAVSYTHLRAHETVLDLVCRLLLEKKKHYTIQLKLHSHLVTDSHMNEE